jgi:hypothetical protein
MTSRNVSSRMSPILGMYALFITELFFPTSPSQAQTLPKKPVWESAPVNQSGTSIQWSSVKQFGKLPPQFMPIPPSFTPQELAAKPRVEGPYQSRGIYGVGGGVRAGTYTGDSTSGIVTGRLGYKLDNNFSLSLRPSGIFGPSNNNDNNYDGFEFRLPLTVDLFYHSLISPFVGGGIATNVDNTGATNGMLTGGIDFNLSKWITVGVNVNYIYQTNIEDTDWETLGLIYLRF